MLGLSERSGFRWSCQEEADWTCRGSLWSRDWWAYHRSRQVTVGISKALDTAACFTLYQQWLLSTEPTGHAISYLLTLIWSVIFLNKNVFSMASRNNAFSLCSRVFCSISFFVFCSCKEAFWVVTSSPHPPPPLHQKEYIALSAIVP